MKINKYNLFLFLCIFSLFYFSQNIDSLKTVLKGCRQDTTRLFVLDLLSEQCNEEEILKYSMPAIELSNKLLLNTQDKNTRLRILGYLSSQYGNTGYYYSLYGNVSMAIAYYNRSLKIHQQTNKKQGIASIYNRFGQLYEAQGNGLLALDYYNRSLSILENLNDLPGITFALNNIGTIYYKYGDVNKALKCLEKVLKIQEQIKDKKGISLSFNNIGIIYHSQKDLAKALEYYSKSLTIEKKLEDYNGISNSLSNIGSIYLDQGDMLKARNFYEQSLVIREKIKEKSGISNCLNNLGVTYRAQNETSTALDYFYKSLAIRKYIHDKKGIASTLNNISSTYLQQKKYAFAKSYADTSLRLSKELGFPENICYCEGTISKIDSALGDYYNAFNHYKQYIIYRDSVSNEKNRKAIIKNQLKYEFEKKEAIIIEQQEKERSVSIEKNRLQQTIIYSVIVGLFFVLSFTVLIFRSLKTVKKQKLLIEEKQKEILESIRYAKRIQKSLLPTESYIEKNLKRTGNK